MCNCEKEMSEKLVAHARLQVKTTPGFQKIEDSYFTHKVFGLFDSGLGRAPIMIPFKVEYSRKAKNGIVRTYKKEITVHPLFCPFCGCEYERRRFNQIS